ncbi:MAG: hypothetical protein A3J06_00910 [Candidatus Moranbacteria bacterium RIFCSPLOWO2_02_FULL_48_19]|nr:MAG: hypothetical protein A3J06_00910 [Candidatus Moranbacteria bacterium RIFCSPLOWO2_02_FULL_48_19]OGI31558.1 MAG: hypothetical protein A3G09_04565 [Candidatus Moranbacteria bacterium RIFCSPLOWO2_12_FULL_48_12]
MQRFHRWSAQSKWGRFHNFFTLLRRSLLKKTRIIGKLSWFLNKESELLNKIYREILDSRRYATEHVMEGGSTSPQQSPLTDFPRQYSAIRLYCEVLREIGEQSAADELSRIKEGQQYDPDMIPPLRKLLGLED